jgi:hypothetical protein
MTQISVTIGLVSKADHKRSLVTQYKSCSWPVESGDSARHCRNRANTSCITYKTENLFRHSEKRQKQDQKAALLDLGHAWT